MWSTVTVVALGCAEAARLWPEFAWRAANFERGAFHEVLMIAGEVVARISRSRFADAMPERVELLADLGGQLAGMSVPVPVSPVERWSPGRAGVLLSYLPGDTRDREQRVPIADLRAAIAAIETAGPLLTRRGMRGWCGGAAFPRLVTEVVVPQLAADIATAATAAVRELLEAEQSAPSGPVHGDLTSYNLLWHGEVVTGILDWDAAGTGDPAVDIAGILTTFGTETAVALTDVPTLERA